MLIYIMGPSCAGKSTFAREHMKTGDVVLDFDSIAQALGSGAPHEHPKAVSDLVHPMRVVAESKALAEGFDATVWAIRSWLPEDRIKEFGNQGARFVVLDPGEDVALERAEKDGRPDGTADHIKSWYQNPPVIPDGFLWEEEVKGAVMKTKTALFEVKETPDVGEGIFTGYASVFGNKDSYGDVVAPGAFGESLKSFGEGGANIPCYWSHQMNDPMKCIGWTTKAAEDDHGLKVEVKLDLDNPNGAQAYKLIKAGVVNQMSFAYEVLDFAEGKSDALGYFTELKELKIFEVSLVQVGANQATELLDVKAALADVKAGRKVSASNAEKLTEAMNLIGEVLDNDEAAEGSDEEQDEATDEEQETAKSQELTSAKSRTLDAVDIAEIEIQLLKGAI